MSRLILPDGVKEHAEAIDDPTVVGDQDLAKASRIPKGTTCPCGNPLPWRYIVQTAADPSYEHEIVCHGCRRVFTIKAGFAFDGAM